MNWRYSSLIAEFSSVRQCLPLPHLTGYVRVVFTLIDILPLFSITDLYTKYLFFETKLHDRCNQPIKIGLFSSVSLTLSVFLSFEVRHLPSDSNPHTHHLHPHSIELLCFAHTTHERWLHLLNTILCCRRSRSCRSRSSKTFESL